MDIDPSLERLRLDHRSERAPARLRQRVLERLNATEAGPGEVHPARGPTWHVLSLRNVSFGLAGLALLGAVLLRLPASERDAPSLGAVGPEPALGVTRAAPGEPAPRPAPTQPAPRARPCPIDELIGGWLSRDVLTDTPPLPPGAVPQGLTWQTLTLQTPSCGPLPRHFQQVVPPGTPAIYRGPVVILLPGSGSPEAFALETRWFFDALAREQKAVMVYAKAMAEPRPNAPDIIVGGWQTDPGAHPEVDDYDYLDRIVLDLTRRGIIGGGNAVWLVGKGTGAVMALSAATHYPERYAGVAAFMPQRLDALPAGGLPGPRTGRRLARVLFVVEGRPEELWGGELQARAEQWATALGVPASAARRRPDARPARADQPSRGLPRVVLSPRGGGVRQFDIGTDASGAPGVRVLMLERGVDPFPPPGGADALSLAASRQQPGHINGAEEAWRFLGGDSSMPAAASMPAPAPKPAAAPTP